MIQDKHLSWPKFVVQSGPTCWAAALESWLHALGDRAPLLYQGQTEAQLVQGLKAWNELSGKKLTGDENQLRSQGVLLMIEQMGMKRQSFMFPKTLTGKFLHEKLCAAGHLFLIRVWQSASHAMVMFGISDWSKPEKCRIFVMDPNPHFGGICAVHLSELQSDREVHVCWRG
jgi:hypothetical protein